MRPLLALIFVFLSVSSRGQDIPSPPSLPEERPIFSFDPNSPQRTGTTTSQGVWIPDNKPFTPTSELTDPRFPLAHRTHPDSQTPAEQSGYVDNFTRNFPALRQPCQSVARYGELVPPPGGIRAILSALGDQVMIDSVIPDGPAAKAGLVSGDLLLKVDDHSARSPQEAISLIQGKPGTTVRLLVDHQHETRTVEIERAEMIFASTYNPDRDKQGPDMIALAKIQPPDHPTRDQIRQYILDIFRASAGQARGGPHDIQIAMLEKVGRENLDLLIELTPDNSINNYFSCIAINHLAQPADQDLIISRLEKNRWLFFVVNEQKWEKPAEPAMLAYLRTKPVSIASDIFPMLASLSDPATYEDLTYCYKITPFKYANFRILIQLPAFDLQAAADQGWEYQKKLSQFGPYGDNDDYGMAAIAAGYGHHDALDYLFKVLTANISAPPGTPQPRDLILSLTDADPNEDLDAWYRQNSDNLRFNKQKKKFVVDAKGTSGNPSPAPGNP